LHTVQQAVIPTLPLRQVIEQWETIAAGLGEAQRKRKIQIRNFGDPLS